MSEAIVTTDDDSRGVHSTPGSRARLLGGMGIVTVALFAAYSAVISVLLPQQVGAIDPEGKVSSLALVTSVSFAATAFAQPLVGALSDRTRSRWGRRVPWLLAGAAVGGVALGLAAGAGSIAILAILWAVAQFALNGSDIASTSYLVDRFPQRRRGSVSAILGLTAIVGGVAGAVFAGTPGVTVPAAYVALAAAVLVAALVFVALVRDPSTGGTRAPSPGVREFFAGFWNLIRGHRDFSRVLIWRLFFGLAYGTVHGYLLYLLTDYVGVGAQHAAALVGLMTMIGGGAVVVGVVVGGWLSDRLGRRIPFVMTGGVLIAIGNIAALAAAALVGMFVLAATFGIALGLSIASGLALGSEVIADPERNAGRGLGVINFAGNIGQAGAPLLGAWAISLAGDYRILFIVSIGAIVVSTLAIRGVRAAR